MTYKLVFRKRAEKDLNEIQGYYNKISPTITDNFFAEFFDTMDFIQDRPEMFQIRYRKIRIAPLYRFPYGIHYKESESQIIIYRVLHTKRYFR